MSNGIHEGHRERLRVAADGDPELATFSEYQTLEYLLSFVIPRKDTNPIAHNLIDTFGSLNGVLRASRYDLKEIPNMTNNAAAFLSSYYAIYRKAEISRQKPKPIVSTVKQAIEILAPYFIERPEEHVFCMVMDINDRVLQVVSIGEGLSDFTAVDNNKILSLVTRTKAKKIIIAHNHPGGSLQPSQQDCDTTKTLFYVLQTINTYLADHIIFTDDKWFSFYDSGLFDDILLSTDTIYGVDYCHRHLHTRRSKGIYMYESNMLNKDDAESDNESKFYEDKDSTEQI